MRNYKILIFAVLGLTFLNSCDDDPVANEVTYENLAKNYSNDIIFEWTELYLVVEKDLTGFRPAATSRALAYINMASYETALPGMPYFISNELKLKGLDLPVLPHDVTKYDWNIAINACMSKTFEHFLINKNVQHTVLIKNLEINLLDHYSNGVSQEIINNSVEWGRAIAAAVISYAISDKEAENQILDAQPESYVAPVGQGLWQPTDGNRALFPYWGSVRTFANFGKDLECLPPPPFSTNPQSTYYKDFEEVNFYSVKGTETTRWMAEFWSDDLPGKTFSPPARIFAIANQIINIERTDLETTLHLYCKLGFAENDAAAAAWKNKYIYNVERPVHFVRNYINKDFVPLLNQRYGDADGMTPPFPGYPSGHSTFGGLGSRILADFFGENYYFKDNCHILRDDFYGIPRSYSTIKSFGEENAYSRIYLGVHPRFDCVEGLRLGRAIAENTLRYKLKKN